MRKFIISLLLSLLLGKMLGATGPAEVMTVFAPSGLSLRSEPSKSSEIIDIVPFGEDVIVMPGQLTNKQDRIDWIDGAWIFVEYDGIMGYIFDGYLSSFPKPAKTQDLTDRSHDYLKTLNQYFDQHFTLKSVIDSSFTTFKYTLSNDIKITRKNHDTYWAYEIEIPDKKIHEILNLIRSLNSDRKGRSIFEQSLLFIPDQTGRITEIKANMDSLLTIQEKKNGHVIIEASGPYL